MSRESHGPALGAIWGRPEEESKCWEDCVGAGSVLWKVSLFREWGPTDKLQRLIGYSAGPR